MDPNANLKEQLEIAKRIAELENPDQDDHPVFLPADACRLAELVTSLDEWIRKGGFLPGLWQAARDTKEI